MVRTFVEEKFGTDAWAAIAEMAGVSDGWVSTCPYSDAATYA
jgi:guanylate cyclase soluble subunit beta